MVQCEPEMLILIDQVFLEARRKPPVTLGLQMNRLRAEENLLRQLKKTLEGLRAVVSQKGFLLLLQEKGVQAGKNRPTAPEADRMTLEDQVVLHRLIRLPAVQGLLHHLTARRPGPVPRVLHVPVLKVLHVQVAHPAPAAAPDQMEEEDNMISKIQKFRI